MRSTPQDLFSIASGSGRIPASVVYVLGEAVSRLQDAAYDKQYPLLQLLKGVKQHAKLREVLPLPKNAKARKTIVGRRPLLHIIEAAIHQDAPSEDELRAQTGLRADVTLSLPELAMWCFRDLQARSLCKKQGAA